MNISIIKTTALVLVGSLTVAFAQSKFSGIYTGKVDGQKYLIATTKGGHILGLDNESEGLIDAINPLKSTVSLDGKVKGAVPNGATFTGNINSTTFEISGTFKDATGSVRFAGKQILK